MNSVLNYLSEALKSIFSARLFFGNADPGNHDCALVLHKEKYGKEAMMALAYASYTKGWREANIDTANS